MTQSILPNTAFMRKTTYTASNSCSLLYLKVIVEPSFRHHTYSTCLGHLRTSEGIHRDLYKVLKRRGGGGLQSIP